MSILGYYLVPHPPIAIAEVGKGEEKKIQNTLDAFMNISKEISEIKPETIVLITPHGMLFSDAISISNESNISGDFSKFGVNNVSMDIDIDLELTEEIMNLSQEGDIPVVGLDTPILRKYRRNYELDHGAMVPLYFINKNYTNYKIVHITYGMLSDVELYKFGMVIKESISKLNKKSIIIASGDLSHKLKEEGPYSYSPEGEKFDKELINLLQEGNVKGVFAMDKCMVEEAGECGLRSVYILLGSLNGKDIKGELLSYEGTFGVGYGIMKFSLGNENIDFLNEIIKDKTERLNNKMKNSNPYVKLARENLHYYYTHQRHIIIPDNLPKELTDEKHGVFVSLKKDGQLRGCIGTIYPTTDSVAQEIIKNVIEAATRDYRFDPVEEHELIDIDISVDVLTDPEPAKKDELNPKKHGVIVSKGMRKGLLLPDLEGVDTVDYQLQIACEKAGIDPNYDYNIEKFEVIRYKEGVM
jgi:MEMO1 family protein